MCFVVCFEVVTQQPAYTLQYVLYSELHPHQADQTCSCSFVFLPLLCSTCPVSYVACYCQVQEQNYVLQTCYETTIASGAIRRCPEQFHRQVGRREHVYELPGQFESTGSDKEALRIGMPLGETEEGDQPAAVKEDWNGSKK
jgi:hypothetical protein